MMLNKLGLGYNSIHACSRGCILFKNALCNLVMYLKYGEPRFKRARKILVPKSVLRHFPLEEDVLQSCPCIAYAMAQIKCF